jgi:hypothetical protein
LDTLPYDVLLELLGWLEPEDLLRITGVCRLFRVLVTDAHWKAYAARRNAETNVLGQKDLAVPPESWKRYALTLRRFTADLGRRLKFVKETNVRPLWPLYPHEVRYNSQCYRASFMMSMNDFPYQVLTNEPMAHTELLFMSLRSSVRMSVPAINGLLALFVKVMPDVVLAVYQDRLVAYRLADVWETTSPSRVWDTTSPSPVCEIKGDFSDADSLLTTFVPGHPSLVVFLVVRVNKIHLRFVDLGTGTVVAYSMARPRGFHTERDQYRCDYHLKVTSDGQSLVVYKEDELRNNPMVFWRCRLS